MCISPSAAGGLGLTLTLCSGFGVAVPSAELNCDDLCHHLPSGSRDLLLFLDFFFPRNVSQHIFRSHLSLSLESALFKNKSLVVC